MDDMKDILSIAKDLLEILVLLLTAGKLIKGDKKKSKSRAKGKRGK